MNRKNTAATDRLIKQYMVLIFAWDACGNQICHCNSVVEGKWLEENVLRAFVYIFLVLEMKVS